MFRYIIFLFCYTYNFRCSFYGVPCYHKRLFLGAMISAILEMSEYEQELIVSHLEIKDIVVN